MFTNNRYGANTKIYQQNGSATIKLLTFLAVVGTIGAIAWSLFQAFGNWTEGVNRTWTPGNNDTLIGAFADVFGTTMYLIVGGVMLAVVAPWIIRNWKAALYAPIPGTRERTSFNVIEADEPAALLAEPSYGLMLDDSHQEHYIGTERQLTSHAQPLVYTEYQEEEF